MTGEQSAATFERATDLAVDSPTLIEGLPGHGLVAAIAVDQITSQLGLERYGNVSSGAFPPVVTYEDGVVHDLVRVYAGTDPAVLTLESDIALPESAYGPLSECVLQDLASECEKAVFLAGAPASSEAEIGEVTGVATTESLVEELVAADVPVAEEPGLVGGVTGSLMRSCYRAEVPALLFIVRAHPFLPDPEAAKAVIETALEPLVEFDVDTTPLDDQADEIQRRMQQVAEQYQQMARDRPDTEQQPAQGMFQ